MYAKNEKKIVIEQKVNKSLIPGNPLSWKAFRLTQENTSLSICKIVSNYWLIRLTKAGGKELKPHLVMCPRWIGTFLKTKLS